MSVNPEFRLTVDNTARKISRTSDSIDRQCSAARTRRAALRSSSKSRIVKVAINRSRLVLSLQAKLAVREGRGVVISIQQTRRIVGQNAPLAETTAALGADADSPAYLPSTTASSLASASTG
jgi:hypothetical protein